MHRILAALAAAAAFYLSAPALAQSGPEADMAAAQSAYQRGDIDAMLPSLARVLEARNAKPATKAEAFDLKASYEFLTLHDLDAAVSTLNDALAFFPGDVHFLTLRGAYRSTAGYPELALPDLDAAVRAAPYGPIVRRGRGFAMLQLGRFEDAAEDMQVALGARSYSPFLALELHIVRMRTGVDDRVEFEGNTARFDAKAWPAPIIAFYRGTLSAEAVVATAKASPAGDQAGNVCEAYYYVGQAAMTAGDLATAKTLFEQAVAVCPFDFSEGAGAKAELSRM